MNENKWNKFLNEGNLKDYDLGGVIPLYHYSKSDADTIVLDPKHFLSHRNSYSKKEYERSQVPRTFFYLDPSQAENIVAQSRTLYTTKVPASSVYNLKKDPDEILKKSSPPGAFFVDYNKVFDTIKENYQGVFYDVGSFDVIAWFEPLSVDKKEVK